jgi:nicotinate phosphoribosyltransferase
MSFELGYLRKLKVFTEDYLSFLDGFQLSNDQVRIQKDPFEIEVSGYMHRITFWETMILSIVNEVYFDSVSAFQDSDANARLQKKIEMGNHHLFLYIADFGTRRRRSHAWQSLVLSQLKTRMSSFYGTSNVNFARTLKMRPVGTMAHEFMQAMQAVVHPRDSQKYALECWLKEYRGEISIALTDVVGLDAFLKDFDEYLAHAYQGVRQDSGDPFEAGEKIIDHYKSLNVDPKDKVLVFSDGLDFETIVKLHLKFYPRIHDMYGIGTNLMNDGFGEPLQIVMKLVECNGRPVAKLSDSPGKAMCDDETYLAYLRRTFS